MKMPFQLAVIAALSASPAIAFEARNGADVNAVSAGVFEVIEGGGLGARSTWCAAADYAERQLGASGSDRIYVATARGDSQTVAGRKSVGFTMAAPAEEPTGIKILSLTLRTQGSSLPMHHARGFCQDRRLIRSN